MLEREKNEIVVCHLFGEISEMVHPHIVLGLLLSSLNKSLLLSISGSHTPASWNPIQTFKSLLSTLFPEPLPLINPGVLSTLTSYFPTSFPSFTHWVQDLTSSCLEYQKALLTDLPDS